MLFKDKIYQTELEKNGYVIIPFLTTDEVINLNSFNYKVHNGEDPPNFIENIHMTSWCLNDEYKKTISNGLTNIFTNACERFFKNYRRLNHVFIIKKSVKESSFKVHQDWNVVDETKYQSVNVWVPLHDVNGKSGALWILKESHKINRNIRGAGYLFPDYSKFTNDLERSAISVNLKVGQAIVFFHSVIHGSPPNLANKNREAACFSIIPKEAPLRIYYQPEKDLNLEVHEPSDDFMFHYKELRKEAHINPPSKSPLKILPSYINNPVSEEELNLFLKKKNHFFNWFK